MLLKRETVMKNILMDNSSTALDQADEEILTYMISDEALEAAVPRARISGPPDTVSDTVCVSCYPGCKAIF
jgi:hypothetical protein